MPVLCQEYMLFFCLPLSSQPRLRLLRPLSISQHISAYKKNKGGAGGSASTSGYMGEKYFAPMLPLVEDMSKIYAHPLPRVYATFLFAMPPAPPLFFLYAAIC